MDLSIIIINWNSVAYLKTCLATVYAKTHGVECEIIVVDNASFDGCAEMIARQFPQVTFIQSETNLGFAGANNLAVAHSSGSTLLFLNPDTEVIGKSITTMFDVLQGMPDAGVVGAKLFNTDGTIQISCIKTFPSILTELIDADILRRAFPKLRVWGTRPLLEKQHGPVSVDVVSGACMMLKRSVFEKVGRFTIEYFMYSEDVDLCFKVRHAGFNNYYVDQAIVVHHGGASTSRNTGDYASVIVMRDSKSKFFSLHYGRLYAIAYRISVGLIAFLRCGVLVTSIVLRQHNTRLRPSLFKWVAVFLWALGVSAHIPVKLPRASVKDVALPEHDPVVGAHAGVCMQQNTSAMSSSCEKDSEFTC